MRDRVMPLNCCPSQSIQGDLHCLPLPRGLVALYKMQKRFTGFLGVGDSPRFSARNECSCVAHLPAHFGIKRRAVQHHSNTLLFTHHFQHRRLRGLLLKSRELSARTTLKMRHAHDLLFLSRARAFTLFIHQGIKAGIIDLQSGLACHQFRKIERETVRVVQLEGKFSR